MVMYEHVCITCGQTFTSPQPERKRCRRGCSVPPRNPRTLAERFWLKVNKTTGCWLWISATNEHGYGLIGNGPRGSIPLKAHRASWELHFGPIPLGANVLHRCDNPPCVRPDHLFLGTKRDNSQDMATKARVGNQHGRKWGPSKRPR